MAAGVTRLLSTMLFGLAATDAVTFAQVAVVVAFATAIEYLCSPLLGIYTYRLHNVPAFVPPGHGLVYLAALALEMGGALRVPLPLKRR